MRGRLTLLVLTGIIASASNALAASPVHSSASTNGIGIRLIDVGTSRGDPFARSYIVGRQAPGTSLTRQIAISNTTKGAAVVAVYAAAAGLPHGTFAWRPGRSRNELSSWTTVGQAVLRMPPATRAVDSVVIKVPAGASSGERYAVIWAEVSGPAKPTGGVRIVNRVGVRMYISIGFGRTAGPSFAIGALTAERSETGRPLVVATVKNDGGTTLAIEGTLTLSKGPGGIRAGPFQVKLDDAIAPGNSNPATVRLDQRLPNGPWLAKLRLRSGSLERTATATLHFPGRGGFARPFSRSLLAVMIALGLLTIAALTLLLSSRRTQRRDGGIHPAAT